MASKFTETLEFARYLIRVHQSEGRKGFSTRLDRFVGLQLDDCRANDKELNSRLMTLLSGILAVIYGSDQDRIIRQQVSMSEEFLDINDANTKTVRFVDGLVRCLDIYEKEQEEQAFSRQVLLLLASLSLKELKNLTVAEMAARFDYSSNYFSQKFRKEQGIGFHQAVNREKLMRAYHILKEDRVYSVKKLTRDLGFSDLDYFRKLFKTQFGYAPSQIP